MDGQQGVGLGCSVVFLSAFALWAFWPSGEARETDRADAETEILGTLPSPTAGERFTVPSDPAASHWLLEWRPMPNGNREALSRRYGANSGEIFVRAEIDCEQVKYRVLGEGDTIQEARQTYPNLGGMKKAVRGTIQYSKRDHVCAQPLPQ